MTVHVMLQFTKVKAGRITGSEMFEKFEQACRRINLPAFLDIKPGQTQN